MNVAEPEPGALVSTKISGFARGHPGICVEERRIFVNYRSRGMIPDDITIQCHRV